MNRLKTTFLLTLLTVLLVGMGYLVGGQRGMVFFFVLALVMNVGSYWFSDRIVLRLYRAQPLPEGNEVQTIVRRLATRAGLPMPKVYRIPSDTPNAFATGRNPQHAAVVVTDGILRLLDNEELEGVLAHELSHVANRDTLISCIAATIAGAIMMIANSIKWAALFGGFGGRREGGRGDSALALLITAVIAPFAAMLIQLAISRSREFMADERGAKTAGSPLGLANALRKLHQSVARHPMAEASPATSHLFIVNPLSGQSLFQLFSTHPPVEQRIQRLMKLDRSRAESLSLR
ncbi:MAG: zinc metalloprotease HtpX [Deltaproteobacteria bacterium]|nr:zinc metalloprotease HtpX [Deltaproteobacteria bacterium]